MVPREFRKALCFVAGLVTLLEAVIWGAASVFLIGVFNCDWNFFYTKRGVSFWNLLDISYLMGGCSGSDSAIRLGFTSSFIPPTGPATSLQVWLWTNAILSAIWIPTCFLLIVAVLAEVKSKNGALLYYPWQALTVVLVVYDFAGAVYHAPDIFQTTTPDNYAKFTYATSWDNLTLQSSKEGITAWLPSLFVTLFFCRFLIIWFLNVFFLAGVYKASNAVSLYKSKNLQTRVHNPEKIKSWRDMFYQDPDPTTPGNFHIEETEDQLQNMEFKQYQQMRIDSHVRQESPLTTRKIEESGLTIEELNRKPQRINAFNLNKDNPPRSPYQQRRNIGYIGGPGTPDSFKEIPPPIVCEITVPPELSRVRPFSYTAGDQPQIVKANISRSNSRAEYPSIPHPDYTIAERRAASLEYIPNRFKVPAPKRSAQHSLNYNQRSPTQSKQAPVPSKKPQVHPRTIAANVDAGLIPRSKYIPQHSSIQQTPKSTEYNINKLY